MKPGDLVGKYRIESLLGEGGMGAVWKATDSETGVPVAVKSILATGGDDQSIGDGLRKRFRREARILLELDHPGIVRGFDFFEDRGEIFFAMEFVEGPSMKDWLHHGAPPPPLERRLKLLRQVAEALEYAHERGVYHRDLKPGNVVVAAGDHPKILDFGLARAVDSTKLTQTGEVMGTVAYMAPEQARGGQVDFRADVFAVGMILAECLELEAPFRAASTMAIYRDLLSDRPVELDEWLPVDIRVGLASALEKDPERRMASAGELAALIDSLLGRIADLEIEITNRRSADSRSRGTPRKLPRVERPELARLVDDLVSRVGSGQGGILAVLTPPGGGRSWALSESRDALRAAGIPVERFGFFEGATPLLLISNYFAQSENTITGDDQTLAVGAAEDRTRLVERFMADLTARLTKGPVAVVFDDLHFAPAEDLQWIEQLLSATTRQRLVIVAGGDASPEGAGSSRREAYGAFLGRLAALREALRIHLDPLPADEIRKALAMVGVAEPEAERILEVSGGNPGLVQILLDRWGEGGSISESIREAPAEHLRRLRNRWDMLDDPSRRALRNLVDARGRLPLAALAEKTGLPKLAAQARLRDLQKKHGWVRVEKDEVYLTQPFLGEILGDGDEKKN